MSADAMPSEQVRQLPQYARIRKACANVLPPVDADEQAELIVRVLLQRARVAAARFDEGRQE